jgi:hypothetical protein
LGKKNNRNRPNQKIKQKQKKNDNRWKSVPNKDYDKKVADRIKKAKETVYTRAFSTRQKFGPASEVRIIDPKEYKPDET